MLRIAHAADSMRPGVALSCVVALHLRDKSCGGHHWHEGRCCCSISAADPGLRAWDPDGSP